MTPLAWAGTMIAAILAILAVVIVFAILDRARPRKADYRDTGHWDNSKRQKWCEWLGKDE